MVVSNRIFLFQGSIFRGYVSFREGNPTKKQGRKFHPPTNPPIKQPPGGCYAFSLQQHLDVFKNRGTQNGCFIMENPMNKWMIWGVKTPIFGSTPTSAVLG